MNTKTIIIGAGVLWVGLYLFRQRAKAAESTDGMSAFQAKRF